MNRGRMTIMFLVLLLSLFCLTDGLYAQKKPLRPDFSIPHERFFEGTQSATLPAAPATGIRQIPRSVLTFPNYNISVDTFPQNEPSVKISRVDPLRAVAAWRDFRTGVIVPVRRVGYSYTTDGGTTWSSSTLLSPFNSTYQRASDPAVATDLNGNFYIATISLTSADGDGKIVVYKSIDGGVNFLGASIAPAPSDTSSSYFEDKEYIACDLDPSSPFANTLYVSWTRFGTPGGMAITHSMDGGQTWTKHTFFSDPGNSGQGSDVCVVPGGDVCVTWLGPGVMFDRSTDAGTTFGTDVMIDSSYGYAAYASFPSIAVDMSAGPRRGTLYVAYSDGRSGDDDVYMSSSTDKGATWTPHIRVNDDSVGNGKEQFWPWIAVDDHGIVSIIYYDTRNTPDNSTTETTIAHSYDGGRHFINELVSNAQSPRAVPNSSVRFGDYIGLDAWGGYVLPVWTDERAGGYNMDIYTAPRNYDTPVPVAYDRGWNMVSVPTLHGEFLKSTMFPSAISPAFAYTGSYTVADTVFAGNGYWLRFAGADTAAYSGTLLPADTIPVSAGWNLIGSLGVPVATSSIISTPPGIISSQFFGYDGGYMLADTLVPGRGYWINVSSPGSLALVPGTATPHPPLSFDDHLQYNVLQATSPGGHPVKLYFGSQPDESLLQRAVLPPAGPEGTFDARFAGDRFLVPSPRAGAQAYPLRIQSEYYPVEIDWTITAPPSGAELLVNGEVLPLIGSGSFRLEAPDQSVSLRLGAAAASARTYALYQNYPNPFNPSTTISYVLPSESRVTLAIYTALGTEIARLVDGRVSAGFHQVDWNAGSHPSGIYFYRLTSGTFTSTRKLLLLR